MKRTMLVAGSLLILAAGIIYAHYRSDLSAARQELLTGSRIADTACGPIEYTVAGSGPAVLVIHGAGGGYSQAEAFSQALASAGFTAIAMSRFGYLRTPLPADASPAAQADAHACLLDALGVPAAAAFGVSAGAPSALQYCVRHRARCTARLDDLGRAPQAGLSHRDRDLPALRRAPSAHRQHRRSRRHRTDSQSPRPQRRVSRSRSPEPGAAAA